MAATCPTTEAALQAGLLPAQERQIFGFAKILACGLVGFSTQPTRCASAVHPNLPNVYSLIIRILKKAV